MSNTTEAALKWARRHDEFCYLVRGDLVGWLWPSEHQALIARLQSRHPNRYAALQSHILPPEPLTSGEPGHPWVPMADKCAYRHDAGDVSALLA